MRLSVTSIQRSVPHAPLVDSPGAGADGRRRTQCALEVRRGHVGRRPGQNTDGGTHSLNGGLDVGCAKAGPQHADGAVLDEPIENHDQALAAGRTPFNLALRPSVGYALESAVDHRRFAAGEVGCPVGHEQAAPSQRSGLRVRRFDPILDDGSQGREELETPDWSCCFAGVGRAVVEHTRRHAAKSPGWSPVATRPRGASRCGGWSRPGAHGRAARKVDRAPR